jgi:hypothetical protein
MVRVNTTIAARKRSKDWPEFMNRLSTVLSRLDEDQYLVINVKKSNRYVQFAGQGSYGLRVETTSNHFLDKEERLDRKQVAALKAMGWQPPTGKPKQAVPRKDPDGSPNFFAEFEAPIEGEKVANLAIETLVAILGVPHPGMLEYEAFDSAGSSLEFRQLGLKSTVRKPRGKITAPDANQLLLTTISGVTGFTDLELDSDGDVGVRYGSMIAYARVIGSPPVVHLFSPLVREVAESPALFERINELNRGSREVRYFVIEGTIFAAADVSMEPFVEAIVANAYRHFCQAADDVDELLQAEFGGKTMYEPSMSSTVRH